MQYSPKVNDRLDPVSLLSQYKRTGNVFINVGETGLTIYGFFPKRFQKHFIEVFKHNPKEIIGITKPHIIIHSIKLLEKYGLVSLLIPMVAVSFLLSMIPAYLLWMILIVSILWMIPVAMGVIKKS